MKILEIRFKNIHSLKGEQRIPFDEQPLKSAGIFAIVGPTGSGKSTILDVITLALYNQIPRIKSKLSKNMIDKLGSIVSHHTNEAWAEVDFQSSKGMYRSRWSIAKTRNNTWADYDMSIVDLNTNKALPFKKSEVPLGNEELIGLNYEQFIKSILLSQGQFSVFLKAKKNERSKLLEDISGHDIYRQIGAKVYEVYKEKQLEIDNKQVLLQSIQIMDNEARESFEKEVLESEEQLKKMESALVALRNQQKRVAIQNEIEEASQKIALQEKKYLEQVKNAQEKETLFLAHKKVAKYQNHFYQRSSLYEFRKDIDKRIEAKSKEIVSYQKTLSQAMDEVQSLIGQPVEATNYQAFLSSFENKISTYDQQLIALRDNGSATRERISTSIRPEDSPIAHFLIKKETSSEIAIQQIDERLEIVKPSDESTMDEWRALLKLKMHDRDTASLICNLIPRVDKKQNSLTSDLKKQDELEKEIKIARVALEKLILEVQKSEEQSELIRKEKEILLKTTSLEEHRAKLEPETPCPLCGSLDHPYITHNTVFNVGTTEIKLQKALTHEKELKNKYNELENRTIQASTALENLKTQIDRQSKELLQEKNQLVELKQKSDSLTEYDNHEMADAHTRLVKEVEKLDLTIQHYEEYRILVRLKSDFQHLKELTQSYREVYAERKQYYTGQNIQKDVQSLEGKIQSCLLQLGQDEKVLETYQNSKVQNKEKLNELNQDLLDKLVQIGFESIEEAQAQVLSEKSFNEIDQYLKQLEKEKIEIQTRKNQLAQKIDEQKDQPHVTQSITELNELILDKDRSRKILLKNIGKITEMLRSDDLKRKETDVKRKEIEDMQKSFTHYELMNTLIGDKTGNLYSNFAQELTLYHLLELANVRLQTMTDRYQLDYTGDDFLQVVDEHQGGIKRSVHTLSGGETFIVSLALALSLSDLASNKIKLDCLFIDEGFGTLDPDTLDMALSTLEKLQYDSNKSIGIISHVESLKERISTKIVLEKSHLGHSSILVQ